MSSSIENIESNCGVKPLNIEMVDPGNNPNFVFSNDPNFELLTLFDIDGNKVGVNSWVECAHYVNGGWSNVQIVNFQGDKVLFFSILIISVFSSLFFYIKQNKKDNEV